MSTVTMTMELDIAWDWLPATPLECAVCRRPAYIAAEAIDVELWLCPVCARTNLGRELLGGVPEAEEIHQG